MRTHIGQFLSLFQVCYEVHLLENLPVNLPPEEKTPHVSRVGWSVDGSDFQLGETKLSWGFGGTGKISVDSKFRDYGRRFGAGDTITCYIDLDAHPKAIFYMLNGQYLGVAFRMTNELEGLHQN
jgi:heterogeneous nuclear ribonucleoprotein U-like protein 1